MHFRKNNSDFRRKDTLEGGKTGGHGTNMEVVKSTQVINGKNLA